MADSKIEWTDYTWNPVTGCQKVSQGCKNCYAETMAKRFWKDRDFGDVVCHYDRLDQPVRLRKPRRIFVNSMSDLFHEKVSFAFIVRVFEIMAATPQHTYQILTKRPERMEEFVNRWWSYVDDTLKNVWLGVSIEDQASGSKRIPSLLRTNAAVRFVSYEPALGPVDLWGCDGGVFDNLDWIIAGGESGRNARAPHPQWFRDIRDECKLSGIKFFFKQWGEWVPCRVENVLENKVYRSDGRNYARLDYPGFDVVWMARVGKKSAGRELDGVEWNQYPGKIDSNE